MTHIRRVSLKQEKTLYISSLKRIKFIQKTAITNNLKHTNQFKVQITILLIETILAIQMMHSMLVEILLQELQQRKIGICTVTLRNINKRDKNSILSTTVLSTTV